MATGSKTRVRLSIPQISEWSRLTSFGSVLKLIWVTTNHHGIIGERCALLPPRTMMDIVSISPVVVTTVYAASALCGPFMIKLLSDHSGHMNHLSVRVHSCDLLALT